MTTSRIDELAASWSADDPDPALRSELEELLRRNPDARRRFLDHCVAEMALVDALAGATAAPADTSLNSFQAVPATIPRSRSPARWWAVGITAAAALVLVCLALWPGGEPQRADSALVVAVIGTAEMEKDGRRTLLALNAQIPVHSRVLVPQGGLLVLTYADGTTVAMDGATDLVLAHADGAKHLRIAQGHCRFVVTPQLAAQPLRITSNDAVIEVVGTTLVVTVDADTTDVDVKIGTVRISDQQGKTRLVQSGESQVITRGTLLPTTALPATVPPTTVLPTKLITPAAPPVRDQSREIVVTTAMGDGADAMVAGTGLDRELINTGGSKTMQIRHNEWPGACYVSYVRLVWPQDQQHTITGAKLRLVSAKHLKDGCTLRIHTLIEGYSGGHDGVGAPEAGENWREGNAVWEPLADSITGDTAPAFIESRGVIDEEIANFLGEMVIPADTPADSDIEFSNDALLAAIAADKDGRITLILSAAPALDSSILHVHTKESGDRAPALLLTLSHSSP